MSISIALSRRVLPKPGVIQVAQLAYFSSTSSTWTLFAPKICSSSVLSSDGSGFHQVTGPYELKRSTVYITPTKA
ncbi:hypothetical protein SCLCIDRAFT_1223937 [Scleroderma citrinum Foug A]|uniref:Uncharacterized protein n=1 Tax=Scleroderma citrinum Foug A TaxID=1036808 RepID=A0A0C2YR92_9AGAM|nr:hypothetical protein SCLCIDRAFT_1223937 [Scleroderma citrinum Foug A]